MGKQVHHETVTKWVCDRCGKEDIFSESSPSESRRLPDGWVCAVIFDETQPVVELCGESYNRHWGIRENGTAPVSAKVWCCFCRKDMKIGKGKPVVTEGDRGRSWLRRAIDWMTR